MQRWGWNAEGPARRRYALTLVRGAVRRQRCLGRWRVRVQVPLWVQWLPTLNATLNAVAAALLWSGWSAVRAGAIDRHRRLMLTSFAVSMAFLVCYVVYHVLLHHYTGSGSKRFMGTGLVRPVYFTVLITHVVLAAVVPVLAVGAIFRAWQGDWDRHRRWAKWAFPIWMYVSVTGVVIYLLAYHWPAGRG
ncbi:MAG: DUF420 domain-containing protein [Planctomycetota bacterium]|nr:MAG: DUF420 domain-containing protein [Planctomycetota bacterium]